MVCPLLPRPTAAQPALPLPETRGPPRRPFAWSRTDLWSVPCHPSLSPQDPKQLPQTITIKFTISSHVFPAACPIPVADLSIPFDFAPYLLSSSRFSPSIHAPAHIFACDRCLASLRVESSMLGLEYLQGPEKSGLGPQSATP